MVSETLEILTLLSTSSSLSFSSVLRWSNKDRAYTRYLFWENRLIFAALIVLACWLDTLYPRNVKTETVAKDSPNIWYGTFRSSTDPSFLFNKWTSCNIRLLKWCMSMLHIYLDCMCDNVTSQDTCPLGPSQVQAMKCDEVFIIASFKIRR